MSEPKTQASDALIVPQKEKKSASEKRTTYSVVVCVVRTAQNSDEESMVVSNDGPRSRRIGSPFQRQVCVRLI